MSRKNAKLTKIRGVPDLHLSRVVRSRYGLNRAMNGNRQHLSVRREGDFVTLVPFIGIVAAKDLRCMDHLPGRDLKYLQVRVAPKGEPISRRRKRNAQGPPL